ncbi:hypothetical protein L600_000200001050 [Isoptericola variabilis J7]|uniref:hypothetical protein n=1 Tax=Isoptericola variabilis TaxID=139208 RepID=UPI0002DFC7E8|nr:hypothetical protein [Isoptericola variabilis]TWH32081.1 hypothetical protein L600_000200001050 [Isoptericola variabilis J7]
MCAWFVREPLNGDVADARATRPLAALRAGLAYTLYRPLFRACLGLFVVINVAVNGMLVAVNLELVRTGTDPLHSGLLNAALGASMLTGAVLAPALVRRLRVGPIVVGALALVAAGAVAMTVVGTYAGYVAIFAAMVLLVPAANAALAGYAAAVTPPQMQGRFSSVMSLSGLAAGPLAPLAGSGLLAAAGVGVALGALAGLLVVTVVALTFVRSLWRIGRPDTWADDAIDA